MIATLVLLSTLTLQGGIFHVQPVNPSDPPRVVVGQDSQGLSVRTPTGELLRGGVISVFKYQRDIGADGFVTAPAHYNRMKNAGLNAVRLICFDPWQASHSLPGESEPFPATNFFNNADVLAMLGDFDAVVDLASQRGMYVMINYHDTGGYKDPNYNIPANSNGQFQYKNSLQNIRRFWRIVATRYRNRTHVFYELTNEPVQWNASNYTPQDLANFKTLVDDVRSRSPDTHLVLCSFADTRSPTSQSMRVVARQLKDLGITFANESIGFHPYNSAFPKVHSAFALNSLRQAFPVINTEQNFPQGLIPNNNDPDAIGFDGDVLGVQSMERMGISWFHWNVTGNYKFTHNFEGIVVPDAISKGYYWE